MVNDHAANYRQGLPIAIMNGKYYSGQNITGLRELAQKFNFLGEEDESINTLCENIMEGYLEITENLKTVVGLTVD